MTRSLESLAQEEAARYLDGSPISASWQKEWSLLTKAEQEVVERMAQDALAPADPVAAARPEVARKTGIGIAAFFAFWIAAALLVWTFQAVARANDRGNAELARETKTGRWDR